MKIEIWSDIGCPWCFIGMRRFKTALTGFIQTTFAQTTLAQDDPAPGADIEVLWRSYQLDPDLPGHYDGTETQYLARHKGMTAEQATGMLRQVADHAASEGLHYDFGKLVVANSLRAHQLLHLARENGTVDTVAEALFSGHFEHGEDIGDIDYLVRVGSSAGIDADRLRALLTQNALADDVRADIAEAAALGVTGVPHFLVDRKYGISGAQPVQVFSRTLARAWSEAHPQHAAAGRTGSP